jgi:hypothetical protein
MFNNNYQGSRLKGRPENSNICKLKTPNRGQMTELTGKSSFGRWRYALHCSAIEEKEETKFAVRAVHIMLLYFGEFYEKVPQEIT